MLAIPHERERMPRTELSFAEQLLWSANADEPTAVPFFDCATSLSTVVRLRHRLDVAALAAGLSHIVRRHDALRSRFVEQDGRILRLCAEPTNVAIAHIDLRTLYCESRPALLRRSLVRLVNRPFDLARGPLFAASLVVLPGDDQVLVVTAHHIVFDDWSKRVLARELNRLYDAYHERRTPILKQLTAGYGDYVIWQRQRLDGARGQALMKYWTTTLRAMTHLALPYDRHPGAAISARSGTCWFVVPAEETHALRAMGRRLRVTAATIMLAVLSLFLQRVGAADDVAIGVPLSDRRRPEFEDLIGLFTNVVIVRVTVVPAMTLLGVLDSVRTAFVDAQSHQDMPYGYLVRAIGTQRHFYQVGFNFVASIPESAVELTGLQSEALTVMSEPRSLAELSLQVFSGPESCVCRFVYKADIFSASRVEQFARHFRWLLGAILREPWKRVAALDSYL